jgi:pyruvate/2-oxoglutarate dehydrogenase complex dihydrolipoamide dehydrogenase (E3) component
MKYDYDLVVIGVGSAGMVAGELAPRIGVRTALVERRRVGGDCLWTGCVPSKALLASARAAYTISHAAAYGLTASLARAGTQAVWRRIREVQARIADTDDNPRKSRGARRPSPLRGSVL